MKKLFLLLILFTNYSCQKPQKVIVGADVLISDNINLIKDKEVVKELIQNDFNVEKLTLELKGLLFDKEKIDRIKNDYLLLRKKLGNSGASVRAAAAIHEFLTKS